MYAIRSYYDYGETMSVKINTNHDHDFGTQNQESYIKWEGTKGAIKAKMGLLMNYPDGLPDAFRITSYNVCYTKLLRIYLSIIE